MDPLVVLTVLGILVLVAGVVWSLTLGRRYFVGEGKGWPQIRRDLYSGSLDEGMYPLDPARRDEVGDAKHD